MIFESDVVIIVICSMKRLFLRSVKGSHEVVLKEKMRLNLQVLSMGAT